MDLIANPVRYVASDCAVVKYYATLQYGYSTSLLSGDGTIANEIEHDHASELRLPCENRIPFATLVSM